MTAYHQRKEPTFGEAVANEAKAETTQPKANIPSKLNLSLHSKTAPGYTFVPVMKRPQTSIDNLASLEEQAMMKPNSPTSETPEQTPAKTADSPLADAPSISPEPQPAEKAVTSEPESTAKAGALNLNSMERVIPTATSSETTNSVAAPSFFAKYRRLLIVLLVLLSLLLVFFWLKPNTPQSVEDLQQGSSLPIEFRPVNEEEAKRAEEEAKALQEVQAKQQAEQQQAAESAANSVVVNDTAVAVEPLKAAESTLAVTSNVNSQPQPQAAPEPKPSEPKVVHQEQTVKKPATTGSVIYQPEAETKATKAANVVNQPKAEKAQVAAKPVTKPAAAKPSSSEPAKAVTKTLTVPKGVSLMQVFRDNHLNISDVNAMSKVNGVVSRLKAGERVTVQLDKNNRVVELRVESGGKFIRQANGSYIYQ